MLKDGNYLNVQAWMITKLNLKGIKLLVYAIIYGFCQDGDNCYHGSLQYLQDWTSSTKQCIIKILKELINDGYIVKEESFPNNKYFISKNYLENIHIGKQSLPDGKDSLPNGKQNLPNEGNLFLPNNKYIDNKENNKYNKNKEYRENAEIVIKYLNDICHTRFKITNSNIKNIQARLKEGYTVDELKRVVDSKFNEWGLSPVKFSNGKMSNCYLRPQTLFSGNFDSYLQESYTKISSGSVKSIERSEERSNKKY